MSNIAKIYKVFLLKLYFIYTEIIKKNRKIKKTVDNYILVWYILNCQRDSLLIIKILNY